ncbi:MAG: glucose-6-phosphate dehydrogenase [Halioglobus sp.]
MIAPCQFVIFGATGDLSVNKLLPALYYLNRANRLPKNMAIVSVSRRDWDTDQWLAFMQERVSIQLGKDYNAAEFQRFAARFSYVQVVHEKSEHYQALKLELSKPREGVCANIVFYLAISPSEFTTVVTRLDEAGLSGQLFGNRIVLEKPFGDDLESARELNSHLHNHFDEDQIFRIDHYLGKETVQNLLVFRFANSLVEPIWNRNYIDHVQITAAEHKGIGTRAGYFDRTGTVRDMLQNHMMQLLSVVAMEPPAQLDADALRDEKVKVLRSIRPIAADAVEQSAVCGQYAAGNDFASYRDEIGVPEKSNTETFVAARFHIDNWRWSGVPFYLRTGKRLPYDRTMISLRLKQPPQQLFRETPLTHIEPNWIVLSIAPEESMDIELQAKEPGLDMYTRTLQLRTSFRAADERTTGAYEALLLDVIEGDRSLFIRFDEVEWSWKVVDPLLRYFGQQTDVMRYAAGSWGPEQSSRLFERADQCWRDDS